MDLQQVFFILNFFINKYTGSWYTVQELQTLLDNGQISYYTDIKPKYATSQLVKDTLSIFRATYDFSPSNTVSGYIVIPSNSNYLDLLDVQITYQISNRTVYSPVKMINEDERAIRLNSQVDPVTVTSPVGEQTAPRYIRLYPLSGYTGTVTYFRRPIAPVFAYTVISGRVIVYNQAASTQLEWRVTEIQQICIKSLRSIGINLSDEEIASFAQTASMQNFQGVNRL
jgi:hypothetical protein